MNAHDHCTNPDCACVVSASIRIRAYDVISRAVEEGIARGWNRAHKHSDSPSPETIRIAIEEEVMLEISDVVDFE